VFGHKCFLLLSVCGLQIEWLLEIAKAFNARGRIVSKDTDLEGKAVFLKPVF